MDIAKHFSLTPEKIAKSTGAYLSSVYILDDLKILRTRDFQKDTIINFQKEQMLLAKVQPLVPFSFPLYHHSDMGELYYLEKDKLYTIHTLLPGSSVCTWYDMEHANKEQTRAIVENLRILHLATKGIGKDSTINIHAFTEEMGQKLLEVEKTLSTEVVDRVKSSLLILRKFEDSLLPEDLCFIHGDYHHGNVLLDDQIKVTGLIDLDWCRIGYSGEDFGYMLMMLLRDYRNVTFMFDVKYYEEICTWYGASESSMKILIEYCLLYAFSDYYAFLLNPHFPQRDKYLHYQLSFLEKLCKRF